MCVCVCICRTLKKEIEQLEHGELDDKLDEMLQEIEK